MTPTLKNPVSSLAYFIVFFLIVNSYGLKGQELSCSNWLETPSQPSFVKMGDLDIPGQAVTVEARFIRTAPWNGIDLYQGDLVSKHFDPKDVNYLLRPGSAEITTSVGYFKTPEICAIELNKTYHAALVYDGKSLKFYRNGFLMSQIAASGDLIQNDWETQVGLYFLQQDQEQFIGYINEVRIWNIPRTQEDIRKFMNRPLETPGTEPGLLAYYQFDNLENKQGNSQWNGSLGGGASINKANPNCEFSVDSCGIVPCPPSFIDIDGPTRTCTREDTLKFLINGSEGFGYMFNLQLDSSRVDFLTVTDSALLIKYNTDGQTKIKITYDNGCRIVNDSVELMVKFSPPDINLGADIFTCTDTSMILRAGNGFANYSWQDGSSDSLFSVNNAGRYWVRAENYCGTVLKDSFNLIRNYPTPFSVNPLSTSICKEGTVKFEAQGGQIYQWEPAAYFDSPSAPFTSATISSSQTFSLKISDTLCRRDTIYLVRVDAETAEQELSIPNAFSPNNDGKNDIFRPILNGPANIYDFKVYNRWGQLVFHSNDPLKGWNGRWGSHDQPTGTYVFSLIAEGGCNGKFQQRGSFILIR